jgi:hypothetical protein
MPRKIPQEKREQMAIRDELEKLISEDTQALRALTAQAADILPSRAIGTLDYHNVKIECEDSADEIVNSVAGFYLDEHIILNVPYVKQKTAVDHITVSNLLFQMKTAEHAIIKLLEEIDNGNLHPRTFEVLSSLQRSKMEIVKHLAQFMIIMENNYKNLKADYQIKAAESVDGESEEVGGTHPMQTRGTRGLIESLRQVVPEKRVSGKLDRMDSIENMEDTYGEGEGLVD